VPVVRKKSEPQVGAVATARQPSTAPVLPGTPVSLESDGFHNALNGAPLKDPFRQQHVPKLATSITQVTAAQTGSSSSSSGAPGGGSTGGSGNGGGGSSRPPAHGSTKVKLRFGTAGTTLKPYELAPLTALPSASNPILIYLGLLKDGKTAAFLVSSDGTPQGDGSCRPSASVCQTLLMKAGDTEFLDLNSDTGAAQYELDVLAILPG
jgi:hypothetical protein